MVMTSLFAITFMFIPYPVFDSLVITHLVAETIINYNYNSRVLRSFRICFQLVFKTCPYCPFSLETSLFLSFTFTE